MTNRKIALEEHFATEEFLEDVKPWFVKESPEVWECAKSTICGLDKTKMGRTNAEKLFKL